MDWTRRLRLQHLQLLVSLMETGNLSGTARAAHTTQPGLSKWLKELEEDVGAPLFERHARGLRPTPYGMTLFNHAQRVLTEMERARQNLEAMRSGSGSRVLLGTSPASAPSLVPRALRAFLGRYPGAQVELLEGTMNGLLERLEKRQLDVVVGRLDNYAPRASLRCEVLYSEAIVVMARPGHPLAQAAALDWEDVRRYDWIVWPPGSPIRSKLDMALTQGGRQPPAYRLESSSMLANIELLRGSDMLSIGSARVVEHLAGLGLVARLALEIPGEGATNRTATVPAKTCWPACAKARRPSRAPAGGCYCKKAAASRQCDSLSFMCRPDFPMSAPILLSAHHRAMHALYSEHHGWLQNWLRGKLGCAADAADLAQDTFLRILLKRELREIGMPRAFLRTIARGLVIDHWRREELQRAYLESIAHLPEAQAPSPEARELVLELLEEISRMLDGLKPKVRTAFLLAQCEDLSHRQIAERMGVSQRSVERYVAEALYHCYLLRYGE